MITTKNLDNLLAKKHSENLFLKHQKECGLGPDFRIQDVHRQLVLSPRTYALLYKISDGLKIKKIRVNASNEETRERAYEVMRFIQPKFNGPMFFIPKVYLYDIDYNLIAYENIEGELLIDQLDKPDLESKINLSAQWLRRLHSLETSNNLTLPKHEICFNFEALKKFYPELANNGPNIAEELKNKIRFNFEPKLIHGDYQPNNIIIDEEKVTVFDFNDSQIADTALDIAKFLSQLRVMLFRFADISPYQKLAKIFLDAYALKYHQENFKIYLQMYYLQILCSLSASLEKEPEAKKTLPEVYKYWQESNGT